MLLFFFWAFLPLCICSAKIMIVRAHKRERMSIKFQLKPIARVSTVQMIFNFFIFARSLGSFRPVVLDKFVVVVAVCIYIFLVFFCFRVENVAHVFVYFSISHWCAPPLRKIKSTRCSSAILCVCAMILFLPFRIFEQSVKYGRFEIFRGTF